MMMISAYSKKDNRTTHEKVCDYYVKKAQSQRVRSVRVEKAPSTGTHRYNYSNLELKNLFEKRLDK